MTELERLERNRLAMEEEYVRDHTIIGACSKLNAAMQDFGEALLESLGPVMPTLIKIGDWLEKAEKARAGERRPG